MIGSDVFSFEALWRQYRQCRRNKRNTINALRFELDAEANLLLLQRELRAHSYRPGRSICFITKGPKPREVFAADFRDRVVHHLLVSHQERVFEPMFIDDSYACRKGKGTLASSDRLMVFLRRATANGRRPAWALKLDVANFFPSIEKTILYQIIAHKIADPELRWLTQTLLFHDPTTDYRFQCRGRRLPGPGNPHYPVLPYKSLFGKENKRGLPIGNLTSQFWGNVYLNELDHFIKRELKCRHYLRYVDDMVLLASDAGTLAGWSAAIQTFLREHLRLALRPEMTDPFPVKSGIDFVGWKSWWNRRVPRQRTLASMYTRLAAFEASAVRPVCHGMARCIDLRCDDKYRSIEQMRSTLASYSGHLRHGAAWGAWTEVWERYPWLPVLFAREGWTFEERWSRRRASRAQGLVAQYANLLCYAGQDCLVFFPFGRFIEFYGPQRILAAPTLGLRSASLSRAAFAFTAGFPVHLARIYAERAIRQHLSVVYISQGPSPLRNDCKVRVPHRIWLPMERPELN